MSSNAIQKPGQKGPLATLKDLLDKAKTSIAAVLPKHLTPDRLIKVALVACSRTPKLLECTPSSVLQSVMTAAELGLDPSGALGSAYLVPYGNTCTLIVGYRGLIDLARRSGEIESIEAHLVHAADLFVCEFGLNPRLVHTPDFDVEDRGPVRLVYAVAKLKGGGYQVEVMSFAEIERIRKRSKAGNSGPWVTDWNEMARKTVVRRICKYLPLSVEVADTLSREDRAETGGPVAALDISEIPAAEEAPSGEPQEPEEARAPEVVQPADTKAGRLAQKLTQAPPLELK